VRFDGAIAAQVELPPGVSLVFVGVGLRASAEEAVGVAVDGLGGVAAVGRAGLGGLAGGGYVDTVADNLHFSESQRAAPGQFDADESALCAGAAFETRELSGQFGGNEGLDHVVGFVADFRVEDHGDAAEQIGHGRGGL
jgi:hypothetical protein